MSGKSMESILSLIAIIVSVVTLLIQHYTGNKHNKINLEGEMFRKIYLESITITIPKFRNEMQYAKKSKKIHKIPQMQNQMNSIRFESLFYKYSDNKFYEKIELKTNDIEDFLSTYLRPNITEEEHKEFEKLLNVYLIELYEIIMNKYSGTNSRTGRIISILNKRKFIISLIIVIVFTIM